MTKKQTTRKKRRFTKDEWDAVHAFCSFPKTIVALIVDRVLHQYVIEPAKDKQVVTVDTDTLNEELEAWQRDHEAFLVDTDVIADELSDAWSKVTQAMRR